jgi:acetyl/propionyl-CoA carboxylase alpha subunit
LECRIYAEDPYNNFAPDTGRLLAWRPPSGMGIRLDSGVAEGQEITAYYDSMLAKLVTWGPDRRSAIGRMIAALESFPVLGVITNIPFLLRALAHWEFRSADYDTGLIAKNPELTVAPEPGDMNGAAAEIAELFWQTNGNNIPSQASATPRETQGPWHGLSKSAFP